MTWLILHIVVSITVGLVVMLQCRDPYRTLLWMAVLLALPVVGLLLFLLVGKDMRNVKEVDDKTWKLLSPPPDISATPPEEGQRRLSQMLERMTGLGVSAGNRCQLYTDFDNMFKALMDDIRAAQKHVHIEFFKIEDDAIGKALGDLLVAKAQQGVEVRLIYDHAANLGVSRGFYRRMQRGGVEVLPFLPLVPSMLKRRANYRNHRKIVVVDGTVGYTGGMNLAQRYRDGIKTGIWRDTFIRMDGPIAGQLQSVFAGDWHYGTGRLLTRADYRPADLSPHPDGALLQVVPNNPWGDSHAVQQALTQLIAGSRQYVYLQSPYLMPDTAMLAALKNSALAGVDVRIMIPEKPDKGRMVQWASHSYFDELLSAGVKILCYTKGYMHAKTAVCDDMTATVGSTNIDVRSLETDFEVNCLVYDKNLTARLRDIFLADQENCVAIDLEHWRQRAPRQRLLEAFARLFVPTI